MSRGGRAISPSATTCCSISTTGEAARAIANFKRLTRAALYVSALTREDWREHCDRDADRSRPCICARVIGTGGGCARDFRYLGFGVWLRKDVTAILWDMERR